MENVKLKESTNWEEIDEKSKGLVSVFTGVVLFLNDQVYNYSVALEEELKNSSLFRHKVKKFYNELSQYLSVYNMTIFKKVKVDQEAFANITISMEDDLKDHIEKFMYSVSQEFLNSGINGKENKIVSLSLTINMLSQISVLSIKDFGKVIHKYGINKNPLAYLDLSKAERLSYELANEIVPKNIRVNINGNEQVKTAFVCFTNKLFSTSVLEKALFNIEK